MIDYHVHTALCNHARGTMEQYVCRAIEAGLDEICFLDHLTLHEKGRHLSMTPRDVPLYYYAARRLQAAYSGHIRVRVGLELDFTPGHETAARDIVERFDFDVIGGSVHFVCGRNLVRTRTAEDRPLEPDAAFYEQYLQLVGHMLDWPYIDVVCHVDMIKKSGTIPPDWFYEKTGPILDKMAHTGKVLEVNTSGARHPVGQMYPDARILEKCRERNIPLCLGSDAHSPDQVGGGLEAAAGLIKNAGYNCITGFDRRRPYEIPLPPAPGDDA